MQRHCRFETKQKQINVDRELSTWIVLLDQIHCPLFHDKNTDFRNRYKDTNHDIVNLSDDDKFPPMQFGVNVDEWLPFGSEPTFVTMEHEVLLNDYHQLSYDTLASIKHEIKYRQITKSNEQCLNNRELLAIKLFTDQDKLQKEFSKSFLEVPHLKKTTIIRKQQFYHWAHVLRRAFKYGHVPINKTLYRGLNKIL
eukprot:377987_1